MADLIDSSNATLDALKNILESAFIDCEISNDMLFVRTEPGTTISIDDDKRYIQYGCFLPANIDQLKQFANKAADLNSNLVMGAVTVGDEAVFVHYNLWIEGGISRKCFVNVLRRFPETVKSVIRYSLSND